MDRAALAETVRRLEATYSSPIYKRYGPRVVDDRWVLHQYLRLPLEERRRVRLEELPKYRAGRPEVSVLHAIGLHFRLVPYRDPELGNYYHF